MKRLITEEMEECIKKYSSEYKLDPKVVFGIVMTESSGRWQATRYENKYRYVWNVVRKEPFVLQKGWGDMCPSTFPGLPGVTTEKGEWTLQRTSLGPMQVMGAVARELGYSGDLNRLNGEIGIMYGAKHLSNLHRRFAKTGGIKGVISSYNCGQPKPETNPEYVSRVLKFSEQYEDLSKGG